MNGSLKAYDQPLSTPTLNEILADPRKVASLPPEAAQTLLIGLTSIQPLLVQRALMASHDGHNDQALFTIKEVAQRLKISEYRAYGLTRQGVLKSVRLGRSVRVTPVDLKAYIAQQVTRM